MGNVVYIEGRRGVCCFEEGEINKNKNAVSLFNRKYLCAIII